MKKQHPQLTTAAQLGAQAYHAGAKRVPALCAPLNKMFTGRHVGQTPPGEASTVAILKAWLNAWDKENLANARKLILQPTMV
jgi:hypothetical protein